MKAILIYLGLADEQMPKQQHIQRFRTTLPEEPLTEQEWMNTFRVSMLYGRQATYFG
jgi:hypothetical protein